MVHLTLINPIHRQVIDLDQFKFAKPSLDVVSCCLVTWSQTWSGWPAASEGRSGWGWAGQISSGWLGREGSGCCPPPGTSSPAPSRGCISSRRISWPHSLRILSRAGARRPEAGGPGAAGGDLHSEAVRHRPRCSHRLWRGQMTSSISWGAGSWRCSEEREASSIRDSQGSRAGWAAGSGTAGSRREGAEASAPAPWGKAWGSPAAAAPWELPPGGAGPGRSWGSEGGSRCAGSAGGWRACWGVSWECGGVSRACGGAWGAASRAQPKSQSHRGRLRPEKRQIFKKNFFYCSGTKQNSANVAAARAEDLLHFWFYIFLPHILFFSDFDPSYIFGTKPRQFQRKEKSFGERLCRDSSRGRDQNC